MLRHSFASHSLKGGADILSISHLLGHEDLTSTEHNTHVALTYLWEADQRDHPRAEEA